jgi:hypothetical protein
LLRLSANDFPVAFHAADSAAFALLTATTK